MDSYGDLTFQNAVDFIRNSVDPLVLEDKPNGINSDCDELIKNDRNGFKLTFTGINAGVTTPIDDTEVSLGDMMAQQGVTDLEHANFLYTEQDTDSLTINHQVNVVENDQEDDIHQTVSLHVLESVQEDVSCSDLTNGAIINTHERIEMVKDNPNNKFLPDTVHEISREVDHAIENILNHVTSRSISTKNDTIDGKQKNSIGSIKAIKKNTKDITANPTKNNENKSLEQYECKICGKTFREKSHLATHSRAHVDVRNFSCDVCGLRFKTKTNLYFHSQTHSEAPFTCTECNKTFAERKILRRHIRVVHSSKEVHECNQCDKTFKSASILSLHYTLHTGSKPFRCSMCPKTFVYKSTLAMHINQYHQCTSCVPPAACRHRARSWLCTVCGKGYAMKATLSTHMKTHDPDKMLKCNECPKTFAKKQSYEIHMKLHKGEGPQYMCDQCSQSYFTVFALRRHYKKHTSQRNFICEICSKAFWMKDALKVHMRSHSNEKPFQCLRCPKAFAHKHTLEGHMKIHRSTNPIDHDVGIIKKDIIQPLNVTSITSSPPQQIQHSSIVSSSSSVSHQSFLFYQLPAPLQPATHIVLTHNDQNTSHSLHVL